jgi:uncharacterized integral membrane protein
MHKGLIFSLILSVLLIVFALQNTVAVSLNLWFWKIETSLALLVIALLVFGVIIAYLVMLPGLLKKNSRIAKLESELRRNKGVSQSAAEVHKN